MPKPRPYSKRARYLTHMAPMCCPTQIQADKRMRQLTGEKQGVLSLRAAAASPRSAFLADKKKEACRRQGAAPDTRNIIPNASRAQSEPAPASRKNSADFAPAPLILWIAPRAAFGS